MKILLALLLMGYAASAQTWMIRWTGTNAEGTPYYWPILVGKCATNAVAGAGHAVLNNLQLDLIIQTNQAAYAEGVRNEAAAKEAVLADNVRMIRVSMLDLQDKLTTLRAAIGTATTAQLRNGTDQLIDTAKILKTNLVFVFK